MLNTRYLIVPGDGGQPEAVLRPTANGAAWFVDTIAVAGSPQQEIDLLGETDLKRTAVIAEKDKPTRRAGRRPPRHYGSRAPSPLTEYRPNYLEIRIHRPEEAVAVFSEIFYPTAGRPTSTARKPPASGPTTCSARHEGCLPGNITVEWQFRARDGRRPKP